MRRIFKCHAIWQSKYDRNDVQGFFAYVFAADRDEADRILVAHYGADGTVAVARGFTDHDFVEVDSVRDGWSLRGISADGEPLSL